MVDEHDSDTRASILRQAERALMVDAIDDINKNFDYAKVHKVIVFLKWNWASLPGFGVPSVDELREEANRIMWDAYESALEHKSDNYSVSTGGLYTRFWRVEGKPFIRLAFQVAEWDNEW
jgi:hypothetical protein